jgi:hypothetical protein
MLGGDPDDDADISEQIRIAEEFAESFRGLAPPITRLTKRFNSRANSSQNLKA